LECLGPTPAHFTAELVEGGEQQSEDFEATNRRKNGYHRYTFSYRSAINSELDLHYRIVRAPTARTGVEQAATEAHRVLDTYRATGPLSSVKRALQGGRINRSPIGLTEIELDQRKRS
jgi:hypothetical protein